MSQDKPLPFVYQFAAGAVAGVSEVRTKHFSRCEKAKLTVLVNLDFGNVR